MLIAPSILSVEENKFDDAILLLEKLNVAYLHLDVMDGIFVQSKTYDSSRVKEISTKTNLKIDTHLMIQNPENSIDEYLKTGSDIITIHVESSLAIKEIIQKIKDSNTKCGLSIKPSTPVEAIIPYLKDIDVVLVMSVEPGFGGQKFIEETIEKIKNLDMMRKKYNYHFIIEVDGGINKDNAIKLKRAGADLLVVGTYLMNSDNIKKTYEELYII